MKGLSSVFGSGGRMRRVDYKGPRRRLNLRLPGEVLRDLHLIKYVTGEDQNTYCQRKLADAIAKTKEELKGKHQPEIWEALIGYADKQRR